MPGRGQSVGKEGQKCPQRDNLAQKMASLQASGGLCRDGAENRGF